MSTNLTMVKHIIYWLTFLNLFYINIALAANSKPMSCMASHLDTNKPVKVKIIPNVTSNKVATAQWSLGYPTIAINDSRYAKLPKNAQQFIYYHECAHLKLRDDNERAMDCESINLLIEKHNYSKIEIRRLIQTLSEKFGLSRRWSGLLNCLSFQNAN